MLSTLVTQCAILVVHLYMNSVSASNTSCPTWFYYSNTTQQCECGRLTTERIHCNQQEWKVEIADGFCATFAGQEGQYCAGECPFRHTGNNTNRMFSELPSDPDQLNVMMCGPYNRKGLLCGRCIDDHGPAVYSLDMKCANCSRHSTGYAISLCLFLEVIPITLFFMFVVLFRLNITAGPLLGYVIFCQAYVYKVRKELFLFTYIVSHVSAPLRILFYSSLTLSGSWILQFGRFVIPPFCISGKLTNIHIQMLSLVTAIYPIALFIITCILMELHARNYRIIYIIWKPFSVILSRLHITVVVTTDAVIQAFILLSSCTVIYNMCYIFTKNSVYHSADGVIYKTVLYYDPTIIFFRHDHIPYMLAAIIPVIFLVLIPSLLLCVYPTRIYRSLSRFVSARKRLAITAFAEALHNCYKDGLNGTRDYRALAGLSVLSLAVYAIISYFVEKTVTIAYVYRSNTESDTTSGYTLVFLSLIISYVRPCKKTIANLSLSYYSMVAGILCIALELWKNDMSIRTDRLEGIFIIIPVISHILVITWAGYTLTHRIMFHFGYQFSASGCKRVLTNLADVVKQYFHRRPGGYQVLPDTATQ